MESSTIYYANIMYYANQKWMALEQSTYQIKEHNFYRMLYWGRKCAKGEVQLTVVMILFRVWTTFLNKDTETYY